MNKEVLKNLLNMMQSSDKENHYMAMQAIVNLGDPNIVEVEYKEELLFLWLYGKPQLEDWALVKPEVAELFRSLISQHLRKPAFKGDIRYKERWLGHLLRPNSRGVKKPWVAELLIEEMINEKKRMFKALDFKYKEIQVNIVQ